MFFRKALSRLKSKRTTKKQKKKVLKEVEIEAYNKERELGNKRKRAMEADRFLKEIKDARKRGAKKARVNGKTISIKNAVSKAQTAKNIAVSGCKKAHKAYQLADKMLTIAAGLEFFALPGQEPPRKKVSKKAKNKRPVGKVQSKTVTTKPKKYRKYVVTHTPSSKTRTVHAKGYNHAKDMAKRLFGINSTRKLVARQV